jgi:hypothetical protein
MGLFFKSTIDSIVADIVAKVESCTSWPMRTPKPRSYTRR